MKTYKLEVDDKDGKISFNSECDGFNGFEVLAFLELKKLDIINQLKGNVSPDVIKRTVIKDK